LESYIKLNQLVLECDNNIQTLWLNIDRQKTNCRIVKEHTRVW
jgi:hypothetical protein